MQIQSTKTFSPSVKYVNPTINKSYALTSFKGVSNSVSKDATKLLDENIKNVLNTSDFNIINKVKFHKILDNLMPQIMTPENFINKGRESKVYRISD